MHVLVAGATGFVGYHTAMVLLEAGLKGCDALVHTAAFVSLDKNKADLIYRTNVTGTERVIGTAVEMGLLQV